MQAPRRPRLARQRFIRSRSLPRTSLGRDPRLELPRSGFVQSELSAKSPLESPPLNSAQLRSKWRRRESNPCEGSEQKREKTRTYPPNPRNRLDESLPFAPAPSHMMPSNGAESGHKEGKKFRLRRLVLRAGCGYSWIMSGRAQKVLGDALDLTDEERAELALELVASLDGTRDADADDAWVAEIERRARRVLADSDGGEDWSAARAEIESKLRRP